MEEHLTPRIGPIAGANIVRKHFIKQTAMAGNQKQGKQVRRRSRSRGSSNRGGRPLGRLRRVRLPRGNKLDIQRPVEAGATAYSQFQKFRTGRSVVPASRRFTGSEMVADINGSANFSAVTFAINPGIALSFPWLAPQAVQWQQYRFHMLRYRFVTDTTTGEKGKVILSPDYNPEELVPTTVQQAMNTQDAVQDAVWKLLVCDMTPASMFPIGPRKQIRSVNVPGDISTYDAGRLHVCTTGEDDAAQIGTLFVDYDVELFVPQNSALASTGPSTIAEFTRAAAQTFVTATPAALDFDAAINDGLRIGNDAAGVFTPAAGTYLINFVGSFNDTDSPTSNTTVTVELQKNSAALTAPMVSTYISTIAGGAGANASCLSAFAVVSFSGTDTFRVWVTMTGASGTLTALATSCRLLWRVV